MKKTVFHIDGYIEPIEVGKEKITIDNDRVIEDTGSGIKIGDKHLSYAEISDLLIYLTIQPNNINSFQIIDGKIGSIKTSNLGEMTNETT